MPKVFRPSVLTAACLLFGSCVSAQQSSLIAGYSPEDCGYCEEWNLPHDPVQLHGNTYWVGTDGLGAILITTSEGHFLIDGGLPNSAPQIISSIESLGFELGDIEYILNSHAHYDHAGGLAALQSATGAPVYSTAESASLLRTGFPGMEDPQYHVALPYPGSAVVEVLPLDMKLELGGVTLQAHLTAGHTAGGTTWSWTSCEGDVCWNFVYGDSLTPVSDDEFMYSGDARYPTAIADYQRSYDLLEMMPCDVLLTPHPSASSVWQRVAAGGDALVDQDACRRYAEAGRQQLIRRLEEERM